MLCMCVCARAWHAMYRADSLERQKEQVDVLRKLLETPETFRKVYIFAFDYAKTEGQKSLRALRPGFPPLNLTSREYLDHPAPSPPPPVHPCHSFAGASVRASVYWQDPSR